MPIGLIDSDAIEIIGLMVVHVMGGSAVGVVAVAMGMLQRVMAVQVAVLLLKKQHHACSHQLGCCGIPQNQQRKHRADERGTGKQHRLPQGQQSQPDREAVAKGTDTQQSQHSGWRWEAMAEQQRKVSRVNQVDWRQTG